MTEPLLTVNGLSVALRSDPDVRLVDDVSFSIGRGEAVGLAGESGCGKTTTALSVLNLLPASLRRTGGELTFHGRRETVALNRLRPAQMRSVRWGSISIIFQSALNALDPVKQVGQQISEAITLHEPDLGRKDVRARVTELFDQVGLPAPRAKDYPHQFSGGQRQRVMIALALACRPELIIGDEPTTALDVITQAQILDLLNELRRELGLSMLLITHDLAVLGDVCDRIAVMYAGQIVEQGPVERVYRDPQHPYTQRLLRLFTDDTPGQLPVPIPGSRPDPADLPVGCRFHPRCARADATCSSTNPPMVEIDALWQARCRFVDSSARLKGVEL